MTELKSYETISEDIRKQIQKVCGIWQSYLGNAVLGIYIHGSLALQCFMEKKSDLDIVIVIKEKIKRQKRLEIAQTIMQLDQKPCPLEISALYVNDIQPWKYPTPCQFHYSRLYKDHYQQLLDGCIVDSFLLDTDFTDEDMACHISLCRQRGICVFGVPAEQLLPQIPNEDFWHSITYDVEKLDFQNQDERFDQLLTLCRFMSYRYEKRILSKYEAGIWMCEHIPSQYYDMVENAVQVSYYGQKPIPYRKSDIMKLRQYLLDHIQKR